MKKSHQYYGGDDFGRGYDPFRLVPTSHYNDEVSAPFEVEIISDALVSTRKQVIFCCTKRKRGLNSS